MPGLLKKKSGSPQRWEAYVLQGKINLWTISNLSGAEKHGSMGALFKHLHEADAYAAHSEACLTIKVA